MTRIDYRDIDIRATRLPMLEFAGSYAALNAAENWIQPFYTVTAEDMSAYPDAPASINGVILAKFKAKDSVDAAFGLHNCLSQEICADVQEDIYDAVYHDILTRQQRDRYRSGGKKLLFIPDDAQPPLDATTNPVNMGTAWLDVDPATKFTRDPEDNDTYYYEPWSLYVTLDDTTITDVQLKGVRYCKLLSHQAILSWMLEKSFEEDPVLITPTEIVCDGPTVLESPTNGSCLMFSQIYNNNYYCIDFTGTGFTPESSREKCETNAAYENEVYRSLPCSQRTAEIEAFIPGYQGLTGVCVVHCKAANEFILNIYNDDPVARCGGFDFFYPDELWQ